MVEVTQKHVFISWAVMHDLTAIYYIVAYYRSLSKERPWAEHLTSLPKRGVGTVSNISTFNYERALTSFLQRLEALETNNWTQNNVQQNHLRLRSRVLMAHNTLNGTM